MSASLSIPLFHQFTNMKFRSILLAEARGSMAGATFSRNGNSAYVRARATPVNPRTPSQTASRDNLNAVSTLWRSLTDGQRQSWIDLAKTVPYVNSLGESAFYSGFQLFMKCSLTVMGIGGSPVPSAPATPPTFPAMSITTYTLEQDGSTFADFSMLFNYLAQPIDATQVLVIDATGAFSAGKNFVAKSQYRFLRSYSISTPDDVIQIGPNWQAVFGALEASIVGARINMRARYVSITTGFASPWVEFTGLVAEA